MKTPISLSILSVFCLMLVACASSVSAPSAPTPNPDPMGAAPASGGTSAPLPSGGVEVKLQTGTKASYKAREQFANRPLPSEVVGVTQGVTGSIVLDSKGSVVPERSVITVNLQTLSSGGRDRDNELKVNWLETNKFPTAKITVKQVQGLAVPLPTSGKQTFKLVGDMEVHGTTKPVTWDVTAQFDGSAVTGTATTAVTFTDFGMQTPRTAIVLSVENNLNLQIDFTASVVK